MKKKILMLKEVLPIRMYKCNISRYFLKAETMGPMTSFFKKIEVILDLREKLQK